MKIFQAPFWILTMGILILSGCKKEAKQQQSDIKQTTPLFKRLTKEESGFYFLNELRENEQLNILKYEYLYNGSGVAIGDINNDGLPDIFMGGNLFGGRLFLNKGKMQFEQISETANVFTGGYTNGVCMVDINNDGYDDIYLCKSLTGNPEQRRNVLLINNQDNTFTDKASEYGLDDPSFSTHATFFDYDNDGDLDMYLLNHRTDFKNALTLFSISEDEKKQRNLSDNNYQYISDKLYRNNGNGTFTDITKQAGLANSAFGLGVCIADINNDGWQDIYVANDYADKDHFYINNKNGTFTDSIEKMFLHMSKNSMGCNIEDINNDGLLDVMNLDMMAEDNKRQKQLKGQSPYDLYHLAREYNLGHQIMRNTLQLNNGNGTFSEIAQLAGVSHTDWSWAPLFADFDNDGYKDLFVSNGFYKDITDMDYIKYTSTNIISQAGGLSKVNQMDLINSIPRSPIPNYLFKNNGDLSFTNVAASWGITESVSSNGVVYADLDLDGDLDLIVNNIGSESFLYENQTDKISKNHFIAFQLKGNSNNPDVLGGKITLRHNGTIQYQEVNPYKGYLSSNQKIVHFGVGNYTMMDSVIIDFGKGKKRLFQNLKADQIHTLSALQGVEFMENKLAKKPFFTEDTNNTLANYVHRENEYNDFKREPLLEHKNSNKGPFLSKADVNNDGLEDVVISGSKDQSAELFLQTNTGNFIKKKNIAFETDAKYEDMQSVFFDADSDGDLDVYVVSGGYEFDKNSELYQDRLYVNDGSGIFTRSNKLPEIKENSESAIAFDVDADNDLDLMVFGSVSPLEYPKCTQSYVLINEQGSFSINKTLLPNDGYLGIVHKAMVSNLNNSNTEIVLAGEWMPITVLSKTANGYKIKTDNGLQNSNGWWNTMEIIDIDNDGDLDIIAGNRGLNSFYKASKEYPAIIVAKDFDENGSLDALPFYYFLDTKLYPKHTLDEIFAHYPGIRKKFNRYLPFSEATLNDIFSEDELKDAVKKQVHTFATSIFINSGNGTFEMKELPKQAQFSEVHGIACYDINKDGKLDIILSGNNFGVDVEMGVSDANYGTVLINKGNNLFESLNSNTSGISIPEDTRGVHSIGSMAKQKIIFMLNNASPKVYKLNDLF